jgi:hypothetical protein
MLTANAGGAQQQRSALLTGYYILTLLQASSGHKYITKLGK